MNEETYRIALKDSSHPFYEATWLIFAERMKSEYASKRLAPQKDDLIPYLFEIVDDEDLSDEGALGKGYAPVHAINLLGEWEVSEAVPRLLEIFEEEDHDTLIWNAAAVALEHMGPGMVDEMFVLLDRLDEDHHTAIGAVLSQAGKGNQRAYDWIKAQLDRQKEEWDVRFWAECLLECDPSQAIPVLEERINRRKFDPRLREIIQNWIEQARQE
jgi:HEAT repeat protein